MRLVDPWFEARFYGGIEADGSFRLLDSIDGAQGLSLWCPCGANDPRYRTPDGGKPHWLLIPFANPRNAPPCPPEHGPTNSAGGARPRWQMAGTSLDDLTLTPSVLVDKPPGCWHGFITNGEVR